jgi:DNA-directed RNA polymerase specialized sigma24 family protein
VPSTTTAADACVELFNRVYDEIFDEIRKFVAQKCADTEDISDILQETYLEYYRLILRKGSGYAQNNRALVFKIARRKLHQYHSLRDKMKILMPFGRYGGGDDEEPSEAHALRTTRYPRRSQSGYGS